MSKFITNNANSSSTSTQRSQQQHQQYGQAASTSTPSAIRKLSYDIGSNYGGNTTPIITRSTQRIIKLQQLPGRIIATTTPTGSTTTTHLLSNSGSAAPATSMKMSTTATHLIDHGYGATMEPPANATTTSATQSQFTGKYTTSMGTANVHQKGGAGGDNPTSITQFYKQVKRRIPMPTTTQPKRQAKQSDISVSSPTPAADTTTTPTNIVQMSATSTPRTTSYQPHFATPSTQP